MLCIDGIRGGEVSHARQIYRCAHDIRKRTPGSFQQGSGVDKNLLDTAFDKVCQSRRFSAICPLT